MPVSTKTGEKSAIRELHNGDRMTREEFHRAYENTKESFRAELIGGIVYVASRLKIAHGTNHVPLASVLFAYASRTPGLETADNTTVLLGFEGEPQPDLYLRILPEYGGQSRTTPDDYVDGAPELIAEIANTSWSIDLHAKREDYTRYGVLEYLVLTLRENRLRRFDLQSGEELHSDTDGICRIRCFPGLWIDEGALLRKDHGHLMHVLEQGLESKEHIEFVERLAKAHKPKRKRRR